MTFKGTESNLNGSEDLKKGTAHKGKERQGKAIYKKVEPPEVINSGSHYHLQGERPGKVLLGPERRGW